MVRILDVLVSVEAAVVAGDELVAVVDADPVRIRLDAHALVGVLRRHGVAVGIDRNAELVGCAYRAQASQIETDGVKRPQRRALLLKEIDRPLECVSRCTRTLATVSTQHCAAG